MGPLEKRLREKLTSALEPVHLEVVNESHSHSVPRNSETHFKVVVVSAKFEGLSRIARQRLVNAAAAEELAGGVHALTQRCLTPAEFKPEAVESFESPNCHGGSKRG